MSLPPNYNLLEKFINPVFVETGSYRGDAIQFALDAGFSRIISFDNDAEQVHFCHQRFDLYNPNGRFTAKVSVLQGNTAVCLWEVIEKIDEPITFWLDAHWQMFEDTDPGTHPFPLLQELEQIQRHHIKNHTILIDDMLIMQWNIVGYDINLIKSYIEKINPNYTFAMYANPVVNGIMAATV